MLISDIFTIIFHMESYLLYIRQCSSVHLNFLGFAFMNIVILVFLHFGQRNLESYKMRSINPNFIYSDKLKNLSFGRKTSNYFRERLEIIFKNLIKKTISTYTTHTHILILWQKNNNYCIERFKIIF